VERGMSARRPRLGLVHTVPALVPTFHDLVTARVPEAVLVHVADPSMLATAVAEGVTEEVHHRLGGYARQLADGGAEAVLVTCSSVGEVAEAVAEEAGVPVLRVDAAMAAEAARHATAPGAQGRVAVLATLASTLGPTQRLLEREGRDADPPLEVRATVVPGAADARAAGDQEGHDAAVADAVRAVAGDVDVVVLAQASMAPAAEQAGAGVPVLSSPESGVEELLRVVGAGG